MSTAGQGDEGSGKIVKELCREFEAVLIEEILSATGLFDGDGEEDAYPGVSAGVDLCEVFSRALARGDLLGLGEMLLRRLEGSAGGE